MPYTITFQPSGDLHKIEGRVQEADAYKAAQQVQHLLREGCSVLIFDPEDVEISQSELDQRALNQFKRGRT